MWKKSLGILLIFFGCLILSPGIAQEINLPGQSSPMKGNQNFRRNQFRRCA
jgi:hypothetical protein